MNYKRIYNEIIEYRRKDKVEKGVYKEKHYILPKSLGGTDTVLI